MTTAQLIALCHVQSLKADHNPEDTMMLQITRREIWMLMYGLLWAGIIAPDLEDTNVGLLEKISEILDVQKPGWRGGEETA